MKIFPIFIIIALLASCIIVAPVSACHHDNNPYYTSSLYYIEYEDLPLLFIRAYMDIDIVQKAYDEARKKATDHEEIVTLTTLYVRPYKWSLDDKLWHYAWHVAQHRGFTKSEIKKISKRYYKDLMDDTYHMVNYKKYRNMISDTIDIIEMDSNASKV